ncbi:MAG: hypothetical protein HRT38_16715 [Alteromonadaceae bacterium]|nr:hypothetical protein [Alteromonadaceae bacterium]
MWKKLVLGIIIGLICFYYLATYYSNVNDQVLKIVPTNNQTSKVIPLIELSVTEQTIINPLSSLQPSPENCDDLLNASNKLNENYQQMTKSFHSFMNREGINKASEELIVQSAGIPLNHYRRISSPFSLDINTITVTEGRPKNSIKYAVTLASAMNNKNYQPIVNLLRSGDITNNSIFSVKSILSAILINDNKISALNLDILMAAGLTPAFADFVTMTQNNVSAEKIELALTYVVDQKILHKRWSHHDFQHNLTLTAAENFNSSLFSLWYNLGVSTVMRSDDYNALDMIASPSNPHQRHNASEIFQILARDNIYPYAIDSLDKILEWLPQEVKVLFSEYIALQPQHKLSNREQKLGLKLAKFHEKLSIQQNKILHDITQCQRKQLTKKSEITNNSTFANIDIYKRSTVQGSLKYFKSLDPKTLQLEDKIIRSLAENNTVDIKSVVPELSNDEADYLQLILALQQNRPYEELLPLLRNGAILPDMAVIILTINENLDLINHLKPHGLNIYAKDPKGDNALHYAVRMNNINTVFDYLINNGVDITQGADLLSDAIKAINTQGNTLYYITKLVNNGLELTLTHEELLKTLSPVNKIKYKQVSNFIAEQLR